MLNNIHENAYVSTYLIESKKLTHRYYLRTMNIKDLLRMDILVTYS
jgi:hypothetical protein